MTYYNQTQYIAQVDKEDNIIGKVEKWEAHKKGILHRAISVVINYQGQVVLQHRKHPSFNDCFDISVSTHQLYKGDELESDLETVYSNLAREFNIKPEDLVTEPIKTGQTYYRAEDPIGGFIEHEVCYFFSCEVKEMPKCNLEYAFGFSLMDLNYLKNEKSLIRKVLSPWTIEALNQNAI